MQDKLSHNRRHFLRLTGVAGLGVLTGLSSKVLADAGPQKLMILHTNDTHSRIDPYPANDPNYPGMGGYARRAALIKYFRESDPDLLLLDAGDIFQGTPYYNMYGGEPELRLMSMMKYDAAAIGNHEFDNGLEGLNAVLHHASFPFICANLDFSETVLAGKIPPYITLRRNDIKVGLYGLSIDPKGLVSPTLFHGVRYFDPVEIARKTESLLKRRHKCDLIVCLSHLGYDYEHSRVSDVVIAANTMFTDIIIGGHTHTLLDPPAKVANQNNKVVSIGQTGSGGVRLGVMNVYTNNVSSDFLVDSYTTKIFNKQT